jgi:hypothetical protein
MPQGFSLEFASELASVGPKSLSAPKLTECVSLQNVGDSAVINSTAGTLVVTLSEGVLKVKFLVPKPHYD